MKIRTIEAVPLRWPVKRGGRERPSDYGRHDESHAIIVRVETDDGLVGHGEVHPGYGYTRGACRSLKAIVEQELGPEIVGENPTQPEYIWEKLYNGPRLGIALAYGQSAPRMGRRGVTVCAMGGIDMALWDIFARSLGVPIYKLLGGGYRSRLPTYASGGHAAADGAGEEALAYIARGFRAVKMRVGAMDAPRIVRDGIARIRAVRDAIGPNADLMLDAHGSLNESQAIRLAQAAEEFDIAWFEEPVSSDNWNGMRRVRDSTAIPISTGENDFTHFDFRDIIAHEAADILQPDLAVVGGFTAARRIGVLAHAANLQVAPHIWGSALLFYASLQLAAALPNCPVIEFRQGANPLFDDLISPPPAIDSEGYVTIPSGPGLGVDIDLESARRKFPFDEE